MSAWEINLVWSLAFFTAAMLSHRYQQRRQKRLLKTTGQVVDIKTDSEGMHTPVVSFTARDGQIVTFHSSVGSNVSLLRRGSRITVLYDPADPKAALIAGWRQHFLTLVFGLVAFIPWFGTSSSK